jgi:hypothetical protein
MVRSISYLTYKKFAKKYGIKLSYVRNGKRVKKNMDMLMEEIYKYETDEGIEKGLYYY